MNIDMKHVTLIREQVGAELNVSPVASGTANIPQDNGTVYHISIAAMRVSYFERRCNKRHRLLKQVHDVYVVSPFVVVVNEHNEEIATKIITPDHIKLFWDERQFTLLGTCDDFIGISPLANKIFVYVIAT